MPLAFVTKIGGRTTSHAALFIRLFAGVSAVFIVLVQLSVYLDARIANEQLRTAAIYETRHVRDLLGEHLETYAADLRILSRSETLRRLAGGDATARDSAERNLAVYVTEKLDVAQLRYIDHSGDEIIRVDRRGDAVVPVETGELQNKAGRYYFQQSTDQPVGSIYVSPIDLNVEHGQVQVPWQPTLRLATRIEAPNGEPAGIAIVNIDVTRFLQQVERSRPANSTPVQILNADGFWLAGAPVERLWGFMFGRDSTLAKTAPDSWAHMVWNPRGAFESGGVHYVFATLQPSPHLNNAAPSSPAPTGTVEWKILETIPAIGLAVLARPDRLPVIGVGLILIAAICFGWSRATVARYRAEAGSRQAQAEMTRMDRMAGLGNLVAGVAHELNTPIGNAVTVASTLADRGKRFRDTVKSGQVQRSTLEAFIGEIETGTAIILRGLERAAELVRNFKQISVDRTSEKRRRFRIDELTRDVVGAVGPQFKHTAVTIETEVQSTAEMDSFPGPLGQVLINLVTNSLVHGFDSGEVGKILITIRRVEEDAIEVSVRDTGKGITGVVLKRIFEPFFTTQLGKGGSGLGLSIAYNIVTNVLGGTIGAESTVGSGTLITMRLPVVAPTGTKDDPERIYDVRTER